LGIIIKRENHEKKFCFHGLMKHLKKSGRKNMKKILIADDKAYSKAFLVKDLSNEGYKVQDISNVASIQKQIKDSRPDLVLIGLHLGGAESWDILHDIKKKDPRLPALLYLNTSFKALDRLKEVITQALTFKSIPQSVTIARYFP